MKLLPLFFLCILFQSNVYGQAAAAIDDSSIRSVELGDVVVQHKKSDRFANKVHAMNVFIALNPVRDAGEKARQERTYYVTRFRQPEHTPISLDALELKLKPFDTALFDIALIIYQPRDQDTIRRIITLDGTQIGRKDLLRLDLFEDHISLKQGDFYIGFGFRSKKIPEQFKYRMYSTNKGEAAVLTFKDKGVEIMLNPHFPYVFPFRITYRKH